MRTNKKKTAKVYSIIKYLQQSSRKKQQATHKRKIGAQINMVPQDISLPKEALIQSLENRKS